MPKKATKTLTDLSVKKLSADPTKRLEIPDAGCAGLYLLIQPSGRRSWALRYRLDGRIIKYTLGDLLKDGDVQTDVKGAPRKLSLADARAAAAIINQRVANGEDPQREKVAKTAKTETGDPRLFETMCRFYLTRDAKPNNRRWRENARLLGLVPDPAQPEKADDPMSFILRPLRQKGKKLDLSHTDPTSPVAMFGKRFAADITRSEIRSFLDTLKLPEEHGGRGMGPGVNRIKSAISAMLSWAVDDDQLSENPCDGMKKRAKENTRDRTLDRDDEIRAVWRAAADIGGSYGAIVKLLLLSGQRREEVAAMKWQELDIEKRTWTIPGARTKNKLIHTVPLSDAMMEIIEAQKPVDDSPFVFPGRMIVTPISGFSKYKDKLDGKVMDRLRKIAEERGADPAKVTMAPWTLHDLRRTVATRLGDLDITPHVVEALLNHISGFRAGVAGRYNHNQYAREKRVAIDRWAEFITALMKQEPSKIVALKRERA